MSSLYLIITILEQNNRGYSQQPGLAPTQFRVPAEIPILDWRIHGPVSRRPSGQGLLQGEQFISMHTGLSVCQCQMVPKEIHFLIGPHGGFLQEEQTPQSQAQEQDAAPG